MHRTQLVAAGVSPLFCGFWTVDFDLDFFLCVFREFNFFCLPFLAKHNLMHLWLLRWREKELTKSKPLRAETLSMGRSMVQFHNETVL